MKIVGFDGAAFENIGGTISIAIATNGALAEIVATPDKIVDTSSGLVAADINMVVSTNNVILRVTGVLGSTVNWNAIIEWVKAT